MNTPYYDAASIKELNEQVEFASNFMSRLVANGSPLLSFEDKAAFIATIKSLPTTRAESVLKVLAAVNVTLNPGFILHSKNKK